MKQLWMMAVLCLVTGFSIAQTKPAADVLTLRESSFDFGKIPQSRPVTHDFEIYNGGKDTLFLENVQASCGCTTPLWSKDPIAPGGQSKITVGYNAAAEGPFEKTITIFYNGNQTKMMVIKGEVYKANPTPAPANAALQIIKQAK
jgi:hypothetical protein